MLDIYYENAFGESTIERPHTSVYPHEGEKDDSVGRTGGPDETEKPDA